MEQPGQKTGQSATGQMELSEEGRPTDGGTWKGRNHGRRNSGKVGSRKTESKERGTQRGWNPRKQQREKVGTMRTELLEGSVGLGMGMVV